MKNFATRINDKFANAFNLIKQYNAIEKERLDVDVKTDIEKWVELYERAKNMTPKITRSVRSIAQELGFTIEKKAGTVQVWETILLHMKWHWAASQKALHNLDLYDERYIGNASIKEPKCPTPCE